MCLPPSEKPENSSIFSVEIDRFIKPLALPVAVVVLFLLGLRVNAKILIAEAERLQ